MRASSLVRHASSSLYVYESPTAGFDMHHLTSWIIQSILLIAWSCSAVPVGRLSTRHGRGTSTSQVFRRLQVCRPTDTVTDWRQEFLCSRTAAMEHTDRDPEEISLHNSASSLWILSLANCSGVISRFWDGKEVRILPNENIGSWCYQCGFNESMHAWTERISDGPSSAAHGSNKQQLLP